MAAVLPNGRSQDRCSDEAQDVDRSLGRTDFWTARTSSYFAAPEGARCTAPGFWDTRGGYQHSAPALDRRSCRHWAIAFHRSCCHRGGSRGHRRLMAESLDEPLGVVAGDELADDPLRLSKTLEAMEIEALLFQRT